MMRPAALTWTIVGLAAPAVAQVPPQQAADEIVAVAFPSASLLDVVLRAADKGFQDRTAPSLAPLETRYKGLTAQVRADARAELRRIMLANFPALMRELRQTYLTDLTAAEVGTLRDFYATPAGGRMARAAFEGAGDSAVADLGRVDMAKAQANAADAAVARQVEQLRPEDAAAVIAFSQTGVSAKLPALAQRQRVVMQAWLASINAAALTRIGGAINASIDRYVAARQPAAARKRR